MNAIKDPCVYLVDDSPSVLQAMRRVLEAFGLKVAGFDSAQAFLAAMEPDAEGCLVLDVRMPGMDGLQLQDALAGHGSVLPVIFLTGHGDIEMSVHAMKHGAMDFLTKPVDSERLFAAVRSALEKSRVAARERSSLHVIEQRLASLTAREREVLEHLICGKLNKQVAFDLGTVEKTIKVHRSRIMQKMQVRSVAELVRLCDAAGVEPASGREGR
jgi:FixJ family two-component response regulator